MKTLVVLSALVSFAIAAPALPGEGVDTDRAQDWHLQAQTTDFRRERKSPSEIPHHSEFQTGHLENGAPTQMARSFTLKKPLIVKKRHGYRLYRDSEEEKANADPHESCGRQVKVKLCDEDSKFRTPLEDFDHEISDIHASEDVKHSIRMAKEAVENLQRDLKKMEMQSEMKMAHDSQSDIELHEDIEVARQALKHIHENFGNLESMSLHATTTRDSEAVHDVHLTIAKTEEERMAQWKEAIENIQKNVEIARNIEDSFKSASNQDKSLLDQSESVDKLTEENIKKNLESNTPLSEIGHMRAAEEVPLTGHHVEKEIPDGKLNTDMSEHLAEHNAREVKHFEEDMKSAPSDMIETHIDNAQHALRSENHKIHDHAHEHERTAANTENKETTADLMDMDMLTGQSEQKIMQLPAMKEVEEGPETKLIMDKNTEFKASENIPVTHVDSHIGANKIAKPLTTDTEHERTVEQKENKDKIEEETGDDGMIDFLAKSADNLHHSQVKDEKLPKERDWQMEKAAENLDHEEHLPEDFDMKAKDAAQTPVIEMDLEENIDAVPKSVEHTDFHIQPFEEQTGNAMLQKSAEPVSLHGHHHHMMRPDEFAHTQTLPSMKAAEELRHLHHSNAHWAHEKSPLDHLSSMKGAENFKDFDMPNPHVHSHGMIDEHTMDHLRNTHYGEHNQVPSHIQPHMHQHQHQPSRFQHNSMMHSGMHEMGPMGSGMHQNFHPNMREAMDGLGSEHSFRWKPVHESARGAYASGLSSSYGSGLSSSIGSSSAVGVFPNANTGGCAIPLLLSCSPSVVSGSLAKAHSSYSAPAYRTEDDFGFINKRNTKTMNHNVVKQKSPAMPENKL